MQNRTDSRFLKKLIQDYFYYFCLFRSALNDCVETLKLDASYKKAKTRKAQCLFHLEKYEQCIETCDDICSEGPNTEMMNLKKEAIQKKVSTILSFQHFIQLFFIYSSFYSIAEIKRS